MAGEVKRCSKCGEVKALAEYPRDTRNADGCAGECRPCKAARKRAWVEANREHLRVYAKKENVKVKNRDWKRKNKAAMAVARRGWYVANRERCIAYAKEYVAQRPEYREADLRKRAQQAEELQPSYVRRLFSNAGIPPGVVPGALVEAKRHHLKIKRFLKEKAK